MKEWDIKTLKKEYKLIFNKTIEIINKKKAKLVLLQFPDGLKQYSTSIVDFLEEKTKSDFLMWFGSCFGACDIPVGIDKFKIDLVIQFGHNELLPNY